MRGDNIFSSTHGFSLALGSLPSEARRVYDDFQRKAPDIAPFTPLNRDKYSSIYMCMCCYDGIPTVLSSSALPPLPHLCQVLN